MASLFVDRIRNAISTRVTRPLGFALARFGSKEFEAFTDIFYPEFESRVDWQSGLRDSHYVLYAMTRAIKPNIVVEIGSARGKSTCTLALACRENGMGKVFAIDPHTPNDWTDVGITGDSYDFLKGRLEHYRLQEWCEIIRSTSLGASQNWTKPIDMLFIDGDHTYEGVKSDFESFKPWLGENSIVMFHDSTWEYFRDTHYYRESIGVAKYLAELRDSGFHSFTVQVHPGLTLMHPYTGGFAFYPEESRMNPRGDKPQS